MPADDGGLSQRQGCEQREDRLAAAKVHTDTGRKEALNRDFSRFGFSITMLNLCESWRMVHMRSKTRSRSTARGSHPSSSAAAGFLKLSRSCPASSRSYVIPKRSP